VEIELTNTVARVVKKTAHEASWLHNFLTYNEKKRTQFGFSSQAVSLMHMVDQTFPAGLVTLVKRVAKREGFSIDVYDHRKFDVPINTSADLDWLRDYQMEALEWCVHAKRGIIHAATGSGKTEVIIAATMVLPCKWLVLVHRKELLHQFAGRYKTRTGEDCGVWGDGQFKDGRVIVASVQTVARALAKRDPRAVKRLAGMKGLIIDECHISGAQSVVTIANNMHQASYRLGFSATPLDRSDEKNLLVIGVIGEVIFSINAKKLIEMEAIAKPKIRLVRAPMSPGVAEKLTGYGDYAATYRRLISGGKYRIVTTVETVMKAVKPCMVFVKLIDHGKALAKALCESGARAEFVWGGKNSYARKMAIKRLRDGDIDVLVANVIMQEGVDIPELMSVVLADGGKSVIASVQSTGRGSRTKDQHGNTIKTEFDVYDIADRDCGCRYKDPYGGWSYAHPPCKWLDSHTRKRIQTYKREGYEIIEE
jgi:superfamily II DNA or RNA helicase